MAVAWLGCSSGDVEKWSDGLQVQDLLMDGR